MQSGYPVLGTWQTGGLPFSQPRRYLCLTLSSRSNLFARMSLKIRPNTLTAGQISLLFNEHIQRILQHTPIVGTSSDVNQPFRQDDEKVETVEMRDGILYVIHVIHVTQHCLTSFTSHSTALRHSHHTALPYVIHVTQHCLTSFTSHSTALRHSRHTALPLGPEATPVSRNKDLY